MRKSKNLPMREVNIDEIFINDDDHAILLFKFFRWFQINGEKYMNESIEKMIEIYLKESD